jgi:glucosamine 6-phosphate synthetase-like amidotransferase/phosphosugar isomerase protein
MCRIGAIIHFGKERVTADEVASYLKNMEYFGKDATGIVFVESDKVWYSKSAGSATQLIDNKFLEFAKQHLANSKAIILHTRQATSGSPENNDNNHPIIGEKYTMVHNGVVTLDEKFPSIGQTDTEQMLRCVEKYGIKQGLEKVKGSASIIFLNRENYNLYFFTNTNTLVASWDTGRQILFLASTKNIIKESIKCPVHHALFSMEYTDVPNDTVYRIDLNNKFVQKQMDIDKNYGYNSKLYGNYKGGCGYAGYGEYGGMYSD